jgi:hypothetical protein
MALTALPHEGFAMDVPAGGIGLALVTLVAVALVVVACYVAAAAVAGVLLGLVRIVRRPGVGVPGGSGSREEAARESDR